MGVISWKDCGQQVVLPPTSTTPHAKQGQPHSQEVKNGISSPRVGPGWMTPCTSDLGWWVLTHRPHLHSIHKSSSPYYHSITCIFMCPHLQIYKPSSPWSCVLISVFTISSPYSQALISILMSHLHNHIYLPYSLPNFHFRVSFPYSRPYFRVHGCPSADSQVLSSILVNSHFFTTLISIFSCPHLSAQSQTSPIPACRVAWGPGCSLGVWVTQPKAETGLGWGGEARPCLGLG